MNKNRLDTYLVDRRLVGSRTKAQDLIKANGVLVNSIVVNKPNYIIKDNDQVTVVSINSYVSRAAYKLEHALKEFNIDLTNKVVLDIGSSTGGFTQICLLNNANHIYAIDVGTNQMNKTLSDNKKISLFENTDFRNIERNIFNKKIDFVCCDVSFISMTKIIDKLIELFDYQYSGIFLIKPQYEQDNKIKNFKGIVSDEKLHEKAKSKIKQYFEKNNYVVLGLCPSPITGRKGNKEYLIYVKHKS